MKSFRRILYVADLSAPQEVAIARAVSLAENNQAQLTVAAVVNVATVLPESLRDIDLQSELVNTCRRELEQLVAPFHEKGIQIEVFIGRLFIEVIRTVLRDHYDLVIKSAENPDFLGRIFGSNDMHLLRKCPCPLWLIRANDKSNYTSILAAVDFKLDDTAALENELLNQQILELSSSLALSEFAVLHFVHIWEAPAEMMVRNWSKNPDEAGMAYVLEERLRHERAFNTFHDHLQAHIGKDNYSYLTPQFHLQRGSADVKVPDMAKQLHADLVVMGSVARSGLSGLLIGNTAEAILEQLQCDVLTLKPAGFVSPVKLND